MRGAFFKWDEKFIDMRVCNFPFSVLIKIIAPRSRQFANAVFWKIHVSLFIKSWFNQQMANIYLAQFICACNSHHILATRVFTNQ